MRKPHRLRITLYALRLSVSKHYLLYHRPTQIRTPPYILLNFAQEL